MEYVPFDNFPLENDPLPTGKQGWLLFLDELLQADKYVQGASFKLLLDRMVGNHKLHSNVRIIAAGNGTLNSNADNKLVAPLKSRFTHINMVINNQEFKAYVENQVNLGNWSPLILGFINFRPEYINNFDVNTINDVTTYSSPRTLQMLSKLVQNGLLDHPSNFYEPMVTGVIGESAGIDFNSYVGVYKSLPDITNIINDPANCVVPESVGAQWALSTLLLEHVNPNVTKQFAEYIDRIENDEVKVVIYRTLLKKCPAIAREPVAAKAMGLLKVKVTAAQTQTTP